MKIKVCGMKFSENIQQVAALEPEYLGFIFYPDSPRNFENEIPEIPSAIKKTGVFVDATIDFVVEKVAQYNFHAIQLHGNESPDFCKQLRSALPNRNLDIIKVFSIKEEFDFNRLIPYEGIVDYFLFDTKGKNKGGNGFSFNWEILKEYPSQTPFFLSGGIGPEDAGKVEEFRRFLRKQGKENLLFAVDVNSRFEKEPGEKKLEELRIFREKINPVQ